MGYLDEDAVSARWCTDGDKYKRGGWEFWRVRPVSPRRDEMFIFMTKKRYKRELRKANEEGRDNLSMLLFHYQKQMRSNNSYIKAPSGIEFETYPIGLFEAEEILERKARE